VDLAWFITDEALTCDDLPSKSRLTALEGLEKAGISIPDEDRKSVLEGGDTWACVRVAGVMWDWHTGLDGSDERLGWYQKKKKNRSEANASALNSRSGSARVQRIKSAGLKTGLGEPGRVEVMDKEGLGGRNETEDTNGSTSSEGAQVAMAAEGHGVQQTVPSVAATITEMDDYDPADPAFKVCIRWLLQLVIDYGQHKAGVTDHAVSECKRLHMSIIDSVSSHSFSFKFSKKTDKAVNVEQLYTGWFLAIRIGIWSTLSRRFSDRLF
jgi:hypothetical protein